MSLIKSKTGETNQIKNREVKSNQKQVSQIQSETAASTELHMPMMVLASDTLCGDGGALDAAVQCLW